MSFNLSPKAVAAHRSVEVRSSEGNLLSKIPVDLADELVRRSLAVRIFRNGRLKHIRLNGDAPMSRDVMGWLGGSRTIVSRPIKNERGEIVTGLRITEHKPVYARPGIDPTITGG